MKAILIPGNHSYSDELLLRRIQYFTTEMWCIGCTENFNLTLMLWAIPTSTNIKMLGGSEEKIMCHASARFHVIILITWILNDTWRSRNIQQKGKFGWKIRIQHRPDKKDS